MSMAPKRKSAPSRNTLRSGASSSSDPTPSHIRFRDEDAQKDYSENFSRQGVHSERQVILADFAYTDLLDVIHSRAWNSLCDVPVTCPLMLVQEFYSNIHEIDSSVPLFHTRVRGSCFAVTLQLVANVLRVLRVEHLDYPSYEHLKTVSKGKMMSAFCERPSVWGTRQFTPCRPFAKGPKFMNMVMTFVLHPLSHYNSITKPRARFLLSLLEHLTIDFPSHFILSIINLFRDTATRNKLIFPSAITRILCHFSILFPSFDHFSVMCAINATTVKRSKVQFRSRQSDSAAPPTPSAPSTSASSSSQSEVTLEDIMAQLQRMDARLDTLSIELYQLLILPSVPAFGFFFFSSPCGLSLAAAFGIDLDSSPILSHCIAFS
nr:hypothetical protein CFP56_27900 [Quercus suber]